MCGENLHNTCTGIDAAGGDRYTELIHIHQSCNNWNISFYSTRRVRPQTAVTPPRHTADRKQTLTPINELKRSSSNWELHSTNCLVCRLGEAFTYIHSCWRKKHPQHFKSTCKHVQIFNQQLYQIVKCKIMRKRLKFLGTPLDILGRRLFVASAIQPRNRIARICSCPLHNIIIIGQAHSHLSAIESQPDLQLPTGLDKIDTDPSRALPNRCHHLSIHIVGPRNRIWRPTPK